MNQFNPIQQILARYEVRNVQLVHHLTEMTDLQVNQPFLQTLLKMFEDDTCFPKDELEQHSLEVILDYIQRTHRFYLQKKLPEIEQSIEQLLTNYDDKHPILPLLRNFYLSYKSELTAHIRSEDQQLLPHIRLLLETEQNYFNPTVVAEKLKGYSLQNFMDTHSDTEGDLQMVRESIKQYDPIPTNATLYRILLSQLELFEQDLHVHAQIEDLVLIPRALAIEKKFTENIKVALN
jgi:regulator of cell morphogenesis and NO signaling